MTTTLITILSLSYIAFFIVCFAVFYFVYVRKNKSRQTTYKVKVKFAQGITTRLTLNEKQFEEFKAWENHSDGYLTIGDDTGDHVKLFRENVCAIEVKKR